MYSRVRDKHRGTLFNFLFMYKRFKLSVIYEGATFIQGAMFIVFFQMFQLPGATFIQGGMSIPDSRVTFEIRVFQQKKDEVCHSFLVNIFTKSLLTVGVMTACSCA